LFVLLVFFSEKKTTRSAISEEWVRFVPYDIC
jgi:hypothetical protein